jgi:hypothetical protein
MAKGFFIYEVMITDILSSKEYSPYYQGYIEKVTDQDILKGLGHNLKEVMDFYRYIPRDKHQYTYAKDKWTVKDILLHVFDTERIFAYRALRIARKDSTEITGFDQDDYVLSANALSRTVESLVLEYKAVRQSTITLYESFGSEDLTIIGKASGSSISVRAIGYILAGHENHHNQIIKERYL